MPNALLRPYESAWGHCVATPGRDRAFMAFLNECATELLRAQETRREKCHGQRVHEDGRS